MAEQKAKTALAVEKNREVSNAIIEGHDWWKDNPSFPSQTTYDMAACITVKLAQAGYTIVRKREKKTEVAGETPETSFNSACFPSED